MPFPLWEYSCALANNGLPPYTLPLNSAGLWHLRRIAGDGQCYGSPKNGLSEANHLEGAGFQVRQWCGKTATSAGIKLCKSKIIEHIFKKLYFYCTPCMENTFEIFHTGYLKTKLFFNCK
jgi:hypothetical protein